MNNSNLTWAIAYGLQQSAIADRIRSSLCLDEILNATTREIRHFLEVDRVIIYQFYPDWSGVVVAESVGQEWLPLVGEEIHDPHFAEHMVDPYRHGRVQVTHDTHTSDLAPCHIALLDSIQVRAIVVVPILAENDLWGLLAVQHCQRPRQWEPEVVAFLQGLSTQVAIAIQQANAYAQLQQELEERQRLEAERHETEQLNQAILNSISDAVFITDDQGQFTFICPNAHGIFGLSREDIARLGNIGHLLGDRLFDSTELARLGEIPNLERTITDAAGNQRVLLVTIKRVAIQQGTMLYTCREITGRKQAENDLLKLNQELEARVANRTRVLSQTNADLLQTVREHRLTEALLRESQARFEKLAANVPGVIYQFLQRQDGSTAFPYVSPGITRLCGLTPEQVVQDDQYLHNLVHPLDQDRVVQSIQVSAATLQPWELDFRLVTLSGQIRWVQCISQPERLANGDIFWDGLLIDISDRKQGEIERQQVELELRRSRDLREAIFNESTDAIFLVDNQTWLTVDCNQRAVEMFEVTSKEELLGMEGNTLQKNKFTSAELQNFAHEFQAQGFWSREIEYQTRQGNTFWANMAAKPLQIAGGQDLYMVRLTDISDRRHAEVVQRQQMERDLLVATITQRIRKSLDLQTILDTTVAEIQALLHADRVLVYRLFADFTGQVVAESLAPNWPPVIGQMFPAEAFPPSCHEKYIQGTVHIFSDRSTADVLPCMTNFMQSFNIHAQIVVPITQQEKLWGLLIAHQCAEPRQWESWEMALMQQIANQLAIATQQSELYQQLQTELAQREQAQAQLQHINDQLAIANAELARATRLKDEFLANMSHELRTPLNAILGLSEGLLDEVMGELTPRQKKALSTIENSGQHLLSLITDILDLAKIEAGKMELNLVSAPVHQLCESSLMFVKQLANQKNIHLSQQIPSSIRDIQVDDRRLRQALINLLSNAVKFTPEGGHVALEVWIEQTVLLDDAQEVSSISSLTCALPPKPQQICFSVVDTGIGIAPEDQRRLFQSFTQIDSSLSRQHEGTGLGLALVRRIAELHGGTVTVESAPGSGSRFTVALPLTRPASQVSDRPIPQCFQGKKVLILDDQSEAPQHTLEDLIQWVTSWGINSTSYPLGELALRGVQQQKSDLVVVVLSMAAPAAWTLLAELQGNSSTNTPPLLVLCPPSIQPQIKTLGAIPCLLYPLSAPVLQATLERFWDNQSLTQPQAGSDAVTASIFSSEVGAMPDSTSPVAQVPNPMPIATAATPAQAPENPLILLAEDNEVNIEAISMYLEHLGYELVIAHDGEEAIAQVERHAPDLVLMDVQMPQMNGLDAIRHLRRTGFTRPIIALTALAMDGDRDRCLQSGATDYLSKPVNLKQLINTIQNCLERGERGEGRGKREG
jgi:PAS domain S-box-containing protein